MQRISLILVASFVAALGFACGSGSQNSTTGDTPTEAYKRLFAAVKNKDTNGIKNEMSEQTVALVQSAASTQNKPVEKVYENGLTGTTFSDSLPEIRDERINGNMGAIEVYNSQTSKWEDLPFVLENGRWKLAVGDLFKGTYKSPGKGRDQREKEAANALSNNINKVMPTTNSNITAATVNNNPAAKPNTQSNAK